MAVLGQYTDQAMAQLGGGMPVLGASPIEIPETVIGPDVTLPTTTIGGRGVTLPATTIGGRGVTLPTTTLRGAAPQGLAPGFADFDRTLASATQQAGGLVAGMGAPAAGGTAIPSGMAVPGFGGLQAEIGSVSREIQRLASQPKLSEIGTIQERLAYSGEKLAKQALEAERAGAPLKEETLGAAQEAERVAAAERATLADQEAEAARVAQEDAAIARQERKQALDDAQEKYDAARKELDETKLDIDAAYGGVAGRIVSGLAVAMGAFGASLTGGPNYAMQIVNDRINRELDSQRMEIEKKKGKVSDLGRMIEKNTTLLGDATQAVALTRAQTFRALREDLETRMKGKALGPQQAQALQALRDQERNSIAQLESGLAQATASKLMVGATERARQQQAVAAAQARQRGILEKRAEKTFESELKTQEALGIEAGKRMLEGGMVAPGQAPPKSVEKVLDTMAKPAIGTKDVVGALQQLSNFEQAIMSYGSPQQAPGGSTYGFAQALTPDIREQARALSQTRIQSILDYRRAQTGTAASAAEEKRIMQAAGGDDPNANIRWIQSQRSKLLGELDTALKVIPEDQRAAVKAQILQQGGAATVQQMTGAKPVTRMP